MGKRLDLTGNTFGYLTALRPTENANKRTAWLCRCDCGREVIVLTKNLRNGRSKHCGCRRTYGGLASLHYVDGTCIEMLESKTIRRNNNSGHTGVCYDRSSGKWRAEIMLQGKRKYLGRFDTKEEAVKKREEAEQEIRQKFIDEHKPENHH